jgi:chaperonin GroEL (HSP60 family)
VAGAKNLAGPDQCLNFDLAPGRVCHEAQLTEASMTAQLATADDRLLARERQARSFRDGFIVSEVASDKPLFGGMKFDCGYLSPYFVTDPERMEVTFENVYVLIHEKPINSRKDLRPLLEQIRESGKPLLIIAEDVGGAALATLVVNKLRGPLQVAAVRAPSLGDQRKNFLQGIALLTGGKAIIEGTHIDLKDIQISDLGQATKITIDKHSTVIEVGAKCGRLSCEPVPAQVLAPLPLCNLQPTAG